MLIDDWEEFNKQCYAIDESFDRCGFQSSPRPQQKTPQLAPALLGQEQPFLRLRPCGSELGRGGLVQTRKSSARSCTCDGCRDNSHHSCAKQCEHSTSTDLRRIWPHHWSTSRQDSGTLVMLQSNCTSNVVRVQHDQRSGARTPISILLNNGDFIHRGPHHWARAVGP